MKHDKNTNGYCPSCGGKGEVYKSWNGISYDTSIRCRKCSRMYRVIDMGVYPPYDSPSEDGEILE